MKKTYVFLGIILLFIFILGTKVNARTEVTNWENLKTAIESCEDSNIEIELKQGNWAVAKTIPIPERKKCSINSK